MVQTAVRNRARAQRGTAEVPASRLAVVLSASGTAWVSGVVLCEALVLLSWAADGRSSAGPEAAARTGALAWLVAHHVAATIPGGGFGLAPVGLTIVLLALVARAGATVVRRTRPWGAGPAAVAGAAVALPYAVLAAIMAGLTTTDDVHVAPARALVMTLLLAAAAGAGGGLREYGTARALSELPERAVDLLVASAAALCVLVVAGALGMTVSLLWHAGRVTDLVTALDVGALGGLSLLLLVGGYAPNAVIWTTAYALGTGFAVGTGTSVGPSGVSAGPVPAFPLLGALPGAGPAAHVSLLLFAGPLAAGVVAGLVMVRRAPRTTPGRAAAWALAAGPVVGVAAALACWLAGGAAGPGRLGTTGPSPWLSGLAAAEWVGLVGAAAAAVTAWRFPPRRR